MEAVGQLSGGVAHDFNNLLMIVLGNLETAQRHARNSSRPNPGLERAIGNAVRGAQRAAALTSRLLAFSRRQPLDPKVLDVNRFLTGAAEFLQRSLGETVHVELVGGAGLWRIESDPNHLEAALVNLAVNARDAMPEGGRLIIETANAHPAEIPREPDSEASARTYVRLTIRDTGHGMDAATLERAFEPFFTTKGIGEGTGLGLATVYGIVRQSAGHISVQSELGHGAVFRVYLPAVEGAVAFEPAPVQVSGGSGTILLAEDEEGVRAFITASLERHGYRVLPAAGADEALRVSSSYPDPIDLLVTDVVMPRMRGPELASRLVASRPRMKILYISGYSDPGFDGRLTTPTGARYLQKPFAADALLQAIRETLGRAEGTSRSAG
jgi:CheY-like chemotaxis protein